ncbi:MAG: carbonic anhydrase [Negativicutes bacterium]|nr:carbonic anhydrase [Negativicutes bacterium]
MSRLLEEIVNANLEFVQSNRWDQFPRAAGKPARKLAIFTCMDCRLAEFILPALGLQRGDAKVIKSAGNTFLDNENDSVIISLAVAIFSLGVEEVLVVGHYDCGIGKIEIDEFVEKMKSRGITEEAIQSSRETIRQWMRNTGNLVDSVKDVCRKIASSPIIPADIPVHGLLIHPLTGMIQVVVNGSNDISRTEEQQSR